MATKMIDRLRSLLGGARKPASVDQLMEAVALLAAEVDRAEGALSAALAERDDAILAAVARDDRPALDALRERVEQAQRELDELRRAHGAAVARLATAEAQTRTDAVARLWEEAAALLERRAAAAEGLQAALDEVAARVNEIADLEALVMHALPVPPGQLPTGFGNSLGPLTMRYLAGHAPAFFGRHLMLETADQVRRGPGLAEQLTEAGKHMLRYRPEPVTADEPETA